MLGDREAKSFLEWMEEHPCVNVVSRDRATGYSSAIASTGRHVVEVADKFHLIKNIHECMDKLLSGHYAAYCNKIREKESLDRLPFTAKTDCHDPYTSKESESRLPHDKVLKR